MKHSICPHKSHLAAWLCTMLLISAVSCGDSGTMPSTEDTTGSASERITETETLDSRLAYPDGLPEKDYGGYTFSILYVDESVFEVNEETGEILNDARFRRQQRVEERFHVDIDCITFGNYDPNRDSFVNSVLSGDDVYDLGIDHMISAGTRLVTEHVILDWNDIPYINLDQPWWNPQINETLNLWGKQYYIAGHITSPAPFCMFYNGKLADTYDLEDIYTVVEEGRWTLDKLLTVTEMVVQDLNGDGQMTWDADQFGITYNNDNTTLNFMYGAGIVSAKVEEDGSVTSGVFNERMQTLVEKVYALTYEGDRTIYTTYETEGTEGAEPFKAGRVLILCTLLSNASGLRDMDMDFSVIPYPKFDEAQDGYYTHVDAYNGFLFVGKSTTDTERTGILTEAYAAETWKNVTPVYYDKVLSDKLMRDEKSVEMLDIIFDGILYDFGYVFNRDSAWVLPTLIKSRKTDLASKQASIEKSSQRVLEKLYDAVMEDE